MIVHVALPLPLQKTFSYYVPFIWEPFAKPLARVKVPFGNRMLTGFVVGVTEGGDEGLKEIADILDIFPLIGEATFQLCAWACQYYLAPLGLALKYALPSRFKVEKYLSVRAKAEQTRHLDGLTLKAAYTFAGKQTVWEYYRAEMVELYDSFTGSSFASLEESGITPGYQARLYVANVERRKEEYLRVISETLEQGKNVLFLLPDSHTVGDYFCRFVTQSLGKRVVWYTSSQPKRQMETFFRARAGEGYLILGNKSAVLLPVGQLGLIVVERPEEDEYRNEEAFHFNAVRLAIKSAEMQGIPILLGSVSPPLDLVNLAQQGAVSLTREELFSQTKLSELRVESGKRGHQLPAELVSCIDQAVQENETIAIYTPRRDYASHLYCLECKKPFLCPDCETPLTYHREGDKLACPSCRKSLAYDETCAQCGGSLIQFSATGAEYVEEQLSAALQEPRVLRVTGESIRKKDAHSFLQVAQTPGTIVIGTQILSRLYDLRVKRLILMGQEEFLRVAGYRAHERVFQIFRNLIDALRPEEVLVVADKTSLIGAAQLANEEGFYEEELAKRRQAGFPPYVRLFLIEVEKKTRASGQRVVAEIVERLQAEGLGSRMMGPMLQKRGGLRWRIVLRGDESSVPPVLSWMYGLSGVRMEPDPPSI